jgi:uncharacterized protein
MSNTRQLAIFLAIAFAFAWLVEACMIFMHLPIEFSILATLGPTIGAVAAQRLATGSYRAFRLNVSWPRTLGAAVLGVALVIVSFDILPALATVDARSLHWSALISFSVYNYSTLLGGPIFEEPGWRGFALSRLEAQIGPLPAALLLGVIWAAWHLPMFFYPGWTTVSILTYFSMVLALSVVMAFAANVARFGVIAPILMHAAFNTGGSYLNGLFLDAGPGSGGFLPLLAQHCHMNLSISFNALVAIGGWIGAAAVVLATKGRLAFANSEMSSDVPDRSRLLP